MRFKFRLKEGPVAFSFNLITRTVADLGGLRALLLKTSRFMRFKRVPLFLFVCVTWGRVGVLLGWRGASANGIPTRGLRF